ncbi:hypothetical protein SESBI_02656 [Sesbania bispinosa]|nr:hypothetical protein SESBI_02656 [Sesbania bispinosa]
MLRRGSYLRAALGGERPALVLCERRWRLPGVAVDSRWRVARPRAAAGAEPQASIDWTVVVVTTAGGGALLQHGGCNCVVGRPTGCGYCIGMIVAEGQGG